MLFLIIIESLVFFITKYVRKKNTNNSNKSKNLTIVAKSCPARAVVLLHYCDLDESTIDFIAEQPTSLKLNYKVPGTNLKIINDDVLMDKDPDYILLLAWHLSKPIVKKWKERGLKSKFIIPLPEVTTI